MSALIQRVVGIWQGVDGAIAEVIDDDVVGHVGGRQAIAELKRPLRKLQVICELDNGGRIAMPFTEIAAILPDRTGVLVVFPEDPQPDQSDVAFQVPDNAAIFNADGTLRFRMKNPCGKDGSFRICADIHKADGTRQLGVRACPTDWPTCDQVYVVDGSTPDLSQQTPIWMRF